MRFRQKIMRLNRRELGIAFLETAIALAILGAVSVSFLNGLTLASKSVFIVDEKTTAESLAQSQMEWVKNAGYVYEATSYSATPTPDGKDYIQYSSVISVEPVHNPDNGIQKITVTIQRSGKDVYFLQGYKVDR